MVLRRKQEGNSNNYFPLYLFLSLIFPQKRDKEEEEKQVIQKTKKRGIKENDGRSELNYDIY
jgi:hypothetical protein